MLSIQRICINITLTRPTGVTGSGAVATFTYRGVGVGRSALALESLALRTATGNQEVLVPALAPVPELAMLVERMAEEHRQLRAAVAELERSEGEARAVAARRGACE